MLIKKVNVSILINGILLFQITKLNYHSLRVSTKRVSLNSTITIEYMGQFPRKLPHGYIIKCYKNASRVNRYNFPTVNAIDFLFSTLHTTPFHYGKTYFGALH